MAISRSHNVLNAFRHAHLHAKHDNLQASPTIGETVVPALVERSASTSTKCTGSDCTTPAQTENTGTLVIALAAAIPTVVAIILLYFLHRRIRRKLRAEDANDKHKSLDFGLDVVPGEKRNRKGGKQGPEMSISDVNKELRTGGRPRGLSMDMDLGHPYMLPPGLHGSHESLHSMSRSLIDPNDPYRPVTLIKEDYSSSRNSARPMHDGGSTRTGSTRQSNDGYAAGLLKNASRMSRSDMQPVQKPLPDHPSTAFESNTRKPVPRKASSAKDRWYPKDDVKYNAYSTTANEVNEPLLNDVVPSRENSLPQIPQPIQQSQSQRSLQSARDPFADGSSNGSSPPAIKTTDVYITAPSPTHDRFSPAPVSKPLPDPHAAPMIQEPTPRVPAHGALQNSHTMDDSRRVSVMGMRPLPPDDPADNPEQRANRIRSFYKEYFDDSRPNPRGQYPVFPQAGHYEDEYVDDYMMDGAVYDPVTGAFYASDEPYVQAPYAQPMGRRAMTPPPRGAASFQRGHRSVVSTQSAALPRQFYPGGPAPKPKKRAPPPAALSTLPTPHMLKEDSAIFGAADFAPPSTFRDRQLGRGPDSPTGSSRPYSPAFTAHIPLARSFDDLAVMPSPHALRKSGTFTALDFAPPPRFKGQDGSASETGSIRSNRSGISAIQRDAIRAGAYRVSRLPQEMVFTREDTSSSLKPTWDMRK